MIDQAHKTLAELQIGESCTIRSIDAERPLARRMLEMGLTCGTSLRVLRLAPMGDPIEVSLRGYHLTLRRDEARAVQIS